MHWVLASIIATLGGASYVSFLKLAQGFYDPKTVISFIMFCAFMFYYITSNHKNIFSAFEWNAFIAGILFGVMTICFNEAINLSNNPGIPSSLVRSNVLVTYVISLFVFGLKFSWTKFITIMTIIAGCLITIIPNMKDFASSNNKWILMTILAGLLSSGNDVFSKLSLNKIPTDQYLVVQMLAAVLTTLGIQYVRTKTFTLQKLKKTKQKMESKIHILNKYPPLLMGVAVASVIIFRQFLGIAVKNSDNPSYPRALFNSQFFVSLLLSLLIQKNASITKYQGVGSTVILGGVVAMTLQK